jgi:hypothetical protein
MKFQGKIFLNFLAYTDSEYFQFINFGNVLFKISP